MSRITRTLTANEGQDIGKAGTYIFLDSASGVINVIVGGNPLQMQQGDVWVPPGGFDRFRIEDASGAPNTVSIIVGYGDYRRSEVSGNVSVTQPLYVGSLYDTIAGRVYRQSLSLPSGTEPYIQLWNPTGSGKTLYLLRWAVQDTGGALPNPIGFQRQASDLGGTAVVEYRKNNVAGSAASGVLTYGINAAIGGIGANNFDVFKAGAAQATAQFDHVTSPIAVGENAGLLWYHANLVTSYIAVEWAEA